MSVFGSTFSDFFGSEIDENERIELGNSILAKLGSLGFDFQAQRQILRGELTAELPEDVAANLTRYQELKALEDVEVGHIDTTNELRQSIDREEWYQ